MDAESKSALKFLEAITKVHKVLDEFANALGERPDVEVATVWRFSPKQNCFGEYHSDGSVTSYSGGDFGVSAALKSGAVVDWWIELGWNETNWWIAHNVHKHDPDEDGSHIVLPFPEQETAYLDVFIQQILISVGELVASASDEELFI